MRKNFLLFPMTVLLAFPSMAQDFEYEYEGQTVAYTVLDENAKTCMTREGTGDVVNDASSGNNPIEGKLVLPSNPTFNGVEYTLTKIGTLSFYLSEEMTSIDVPNSVTEIGDQAFMKCSRLTKATLPNSVTKIGIAAFCMCSRLTGITIPNSVTEIGSDAFCLCEGLTEVSIPNSVTKIGEEAFGGCFALAKVTLPNSITKIASSTFSSCSLEEITIPNSVTEIGDKAFFYCSSLTEITIPNSVTEIGAEAFFFCSLNEITIPNSVTKIGAGAFGWCPVTEVNYITSQPKDFGMIFYPEEVYNNATLYVMEEGLELAAETVPWKYFSNIQAKDFGAGVEQIIGNSNGDIDPNAPMEIYTLDGKSVSSSVDALAPGIYIVHQGSLTKKIVVK